MDIDIHFLKRIFDYTMFSDLMYPFVAMKMILHLWLMECGGQNRLVSWRGSTSSCMQPWQSNAPGKVFAATKTLLRFAGEISPYLGGVARYRACSHSGWHSLFPRHAFANLNSSFLGKHVLLAGKNNLFSIKLHHGGKFTHPPKRMYVGGKVNYVDKIDADLFNVDELHLFVQDLGYDHEQLMFYHYKFPNKGLDYGLKPISCNADVISLIKLVANCKVAEFFVKYWLTNVDHHYLSSFKSTVEIEELYDDVLNAPLVKNSKMLALRWINEADVAENSVEKNANVNVVGESSVNVVGESSVDENIDENMNENVNEDDEYDSDENEQDNIEDEEGRGFTFSVEEQGVDQNVTPNVDLTDEALEVLDFDSFDSDVGDDTVSIRRRQLRKLRKIWGQPCGIVNTLYVGQEFANKELTKARIKAHAVETRRKIGIVKDDNERLQAKCKGNVPRETSNVVHSGPQGNILYASGVVDKETGNSESQGKNKMKGKSVNLVDEDKRGCPWKEYISVGDNLKWVVHLRGDQEQQYALLWDYCEALKKANPNTTVKIDVYRAHNPHENVRRFKRIYVCLGALKEGFMAFGRQLLGLDRAFMKGNYPESKESWTWFLSCLGDDFDLEANSNFTFITDRQKGLLPALKDLFPTAEHKYCIRHIHDNMNLIYKGGQYKELRWKCVTATTEAYFKRAMDEFKGYNRLAHEWLRKIPPKH
nr:hypothetical protein [Tanacetum cinerariifolium]